MNGWATRQRGAAGPWTLIALVIAAALGVAGGFWAGKNSQAWEITDVAESEAPEPAKNPLPSVRSMILEDRLAEVAEAASPSVVNVFSEKVIKAPQLHMFDDPFFRFFFGPGFPSVPRERRQRSLGSGVIVSEDGYILTNNHVVEGADSILVSLADKREFKAELVGTDSLTDLAVLKIQSDDSLPVLRLADSDQVKVGQVVLAIGNPFGLSSTVTMGIVSARGRSHVGIAQYEDFIQTDAAINPGNSGGALVNLSGELIGINTAIFSRSGGYQGIGFAIPSNIASHVMQSLIEKGEVKRGWLGVSIQDLTPALAEQFGLDDIKGALVADVLEDTPAEKAGLKAGDVIIKINGEPVEDFAGLRNTIAQMAPGTKIKLTVIRKGREKTIEVKLAERPAHETLAGRKRSPMGEASDQEASAAGMTVQNLTEEMADRLGIEADLRGVVVTDIEPGSRADRAEIKVGDLIFWINHMRVNDVDDFRIAVRRAGKGALLVRLRRGGSNLFTVVPKE